MDPVLAEFVGAPGEDADGVLGDLLSTHAAPVIRRVVMGRLGPESADADDVQSQVLLDVMLRLREARGLGQLAAIEAFGGYVAAAARHGCDHYIRRKYPLRWRLRNRIRYVLDQDPRWAVWKGPDGTWTCGLAGSEGRPAAIAPRVENLSGVAPDRIRDLLEAIFRASRGPLELSTVVALAADAWRVPLVPREDVRDLESVADRSAGTDARIADRGRAERVWEEIRDLPLRQRQALLLNLKDDALSLFMLTGTASLRAIADALEIGVEALAALWHELPLPDTALAARLGCTRQQVINLRMAARKRLGNRLAGWS